MVKSQEDKTNEKFLEKQKLELAPKFVKKEDKAKGKVVSPGFSDEEREKINEICPHYFTLKDRYAEYVNITDDEPPREIPLRIDRQHELSGFEATLSQADLSKDIDVFPTRLIKVFVFDTAPEFKRNPYLVIDKKVVGLDGQGRSTNISSVRTGYYKYPEQFEQRDTGEWRPVNSQFKKIYDIPFTKDEVLKHAHVGNPYIKKYVVWHPDGVRRGHFTLEEFINLDDQEQISLIEQGKR